jgi:hypothetical protein
MGNLSAQSRRTDLGVRLLAGYRSLLSTARRRSSSSNSSHGRSFMWESPDLRPMPGLRVPLREATPYGQAPKYLIRDHDNKFGPCFARVATTSAIEILKTPVCAPRANAICERFLRSVRQECLDHLIILHERQHEPRAQSVYSVLQPGPTASRNSAAACLHRVDRLLPLIMQGTR